MLSGVNPPGVRTSTLEIAERESHLVIQVTPGFEACERAREAVASLTADLGPTVREHAQILVCELVTEGVRHASLAAPDEPITLRVDRTPARLRVEVSDRGFGPDPRRRLDKAYTLSRRGFGLVEGLADAWGIAPGDPTTVWFEIELDASVEAGIGDGRSQARVSGEGGPEGRLGEEIVGADACTGAAARDDSVQVVAVVGTYGAVWARARRMEPGAGPTDRATDVPDQRR